MKGSVQLAKISGIPVRVHWTFALIFVWIYYTIHTSQGIRSTSFFLWQVSIILALFLFVVLHEFGHALTARRFGVKTLDIILSPIGGVARLDRMPPHPSQEFWVAIAGPLVNLTIAILATALYLLLSPTEHLQKLELMTRFVINPESNIFTGIFTQADKTFAFTIGMNLVLALFNLVPAFPLDGGRIFRALLSLKLSRLSATRIAAYTGQILVIVLFVMMAVYGTFDLMLCFIGLFVFLMAESEYRSVKWEMKLSAYTVQDCMETNVPQIPSNLEITAHNFPNLDENAPSWFFVKDTETNEVRGKISLSNLRKALQNVGPPETSLTICEPIGISTNTGESLLSVVAKLRENRISSLPVIQDHHLLGIIELDSIEALINNSQTPDQPTTAA